MLYYEFKVVHIKVLQVPHRFSPTHMETGFNFTVDLANALIYAMTSTLDFTHFWRHPNSGGQHLFDKRGVHFNSEPGQKNFYRSVRGAVICALRDK